MTTKHSGSCLCQQVQYEINGSFDGFFLCHCKHCQKDTGSAFASNLFSMKAKVTWLRGQDKVKTYNLPSTRHTKSFCENCSSALPSIHLNGTMLVVPAGSLDTEVGIAPTAHIFCASKATWEDDLDKIKKFDNFPGI